MVPDPQYRPADHVASFGKAVSAWLVYAVMLIAGLGLPSLWAQVVNEPKPPMTARAPATGGATIDRFCDDWRRAPASAVERDRLG